MPELRPLVFIGRDLRSDNPTLLYFQDARSYLAGVRDATWTDEDLAEFHTIADHSPFVQEDERALDVLMQCSLWRRGLTTR